MEGQDPDLEKLWQNMAGDADVPDWVGIGKRECRAPQGVRFVIDFDGFFVISNGGKY